MTTQFLPKGALSIEKKVKANSSKYWKPSEFKDASAGETKFRVVVMPITGWQEWDDEINKPRRYRDGEEPLELINAEKPLERYWWLYVWDYERKGLYLLEVKQSSFIKNFISFMSDEDLGDITGYDIKVKKTGILKHTRYTIVPLGQKPMGEDIKEALKKAPVRLEALYECGDPWKDLKGPPGASKADLEPKGNPLNMLAHLLNEEIELPEPNMVIHYLEFCEPKVPKPMPEVVEIWISKPEDFLKAYTKWLSSDTARQIRDKKVA